MNSVSVDIKDILVEAGEGRFGDLANDDWAIFVSYEQDEPDHSISIYDTPGIVQKQFDTKQPFYHSSFQLRVRAINYIDGYSKARQLLELLDRRGKFQTADTDYDNIVMDDEPLALQRDSQNRSIFVVNGTAFRRQRGDVNA